MRVQLPPDAAHAGERSAGPVGPDIPRQAVSWRTGEPAGATFRTNHRAAFWKAFCAPLCATVCAAAMAIPGQARAQQPATPAVAAPTTPDTPDAKLWADAAKHASEKKRQNVDLLLAGVIVGAVGLTLYEISAEEESALYDRYQKRDANGLITGITHTDAVAYADRIATRQTVAAFVSGAGIVVVGAALTLLGIETWRSPAAPAPRVAFGGLGLKVAF